MAAIPSRIADYAMILPGPGEYAAGTAVSMRRGIGLSGSGFLVGEDEYGRYVQAVSAADGLDLAYAGGAPAWGSYPEVVVRVRARNTSPDVAQGARSVVATRMHGATIATIQPRRRDATPNWELLSYYGANGGITYAGVHYFDHVNVASSGILTASEDDPILGSGPGYDYDWPMTGVVTIPGAYPTRLEIPYGFWRVYRYDIWNGADGASGQWLARQRQNPQGNAGGWPARQRQNGGASGAWASRQRQTGR